MISIRRAGFWLAVGLLSTENFSHSRALSTSMSEALTQQQALTKALSDTQRELERLKRRMVLFMPVVYKQLRFAGDTKTGQVGWLRAQLLSDLGRSKELRLAKASIQAQIDSSDQRLATLVARPQSVGVEKQTQSAPASDAFYKAHFEQGRLTLPISSPRGFKLLSTGDVSLNCSRDRTVRAVAGGQVSKVEEGADGSTVAIAHGSGYVSIYSGLEDVDVMVGDDLSESARIGTAGAEANGCLLFSLKQRGNYLNASDWLKLN